MESIIELDRLYLLTLAKAGEACGLTAVLQQLDRNVGRLFFLSSAGTRADVVLNFHFDKDAVNFEVQLRNGAKVQKSVAYAEGLDEFAGELVKAINAGRLAAPRDVRGRKAA